MQRESASWAIIHALLLAMLRLLLLILPAAALHVLFPPLPPAVDLAILPASCLRYSVRYYLTSFVTATLFCSLL